MSQRIIFEIDRFLELGRKIENRADFTVERPIEHSLVIQPKNLVSSKNPKPLAITLMAITHGNEVAGLAVINELLSHIAKGSWLLKAPLCVVLGNPAASLEGLRYLDRDLNRSFNHDETSAREVHRAREITSLLDESFLLLDIHQTKEAAESPFFIFPYTSAGFSFAQKISSDIPIVTHWGAPFSNEGMCTDEYTNRQGGCGITLEIGQNGFHPYHVGVGFLGAIRAVSLAEQWWPEAILPKIDSTNDSDVDAYTFAQIMQYPSTGSVRLTPGLSNFSHIKKEQVIAQIDGREIHADYSGPVLFPQYMRHGEKVRPAELIRILRKIKISELPRDHGEKLR